MAYVTKYQFEFDSDQAQPIKVLLKRKDAEAGEILIYSVDACEHQYNGSEGKDNSIIGSAASIGIVIGEGDADIDEDFENVENDEWLMEIWLNDEYLLFTGYVLLDEGNQPFQDKPYSIGLTATDQLGVLKDTPLTKSDGTEFRGTAYIIEYLAAALQQTGLQLPIRVYDNVFHASFNNRDIDPKWDCFNQTKLEYRTFLKDAVTFVSAREALEIILFPWYTLYQWNGMWVIFRKELLQYWPFAKYYTQYDYKGQNPAGFEVLEDYATVGRNSMIYPVDETQDRTLNKAVRYAKNSYDYIVWPEIPKNNKFDLGDLVEQRQAVKADLVYDLRDEYIGPSWNPSLNKLGRLDRFTIKDWEWGTGDENGTGKLILSATSRQVNRVIIRDDLESIIDDHLLLSSEPTTAYLQSEGIPARVGHKYQVGFDFSPNNDFSEFDQDKRYVAARIYMIADGSNETYGLTADGKWHKGERSEVVIDYPRNIDTRISRSVSFETDLAPASGTLYIALRAAPPAGGFVFFSNFTFSLLFYAKGGKNPYKGDFWLHGQSQNLPDIIDETVFLSDTEHKVFKGCLLGSDNNPLRPQWYRMGLSESKHYRQIGNMSMFNLHYRRFMKLVGDFVGITQVSSNDPQRPAPVALHKQYRLVDLAGKDKRCRINVPLRLDLYKGEMQPIFEEVYDSEPTMVEKIESISRLVSRIRTAIDNTTPAQWGSGGFDPFTGNVLPGSPNKFQVAMPIGESMAVSVQGETSVSRTEDVFAGFNIVTFRINKFFVGDRIRFTAWSHNVDIFVEKVATPTVDGQQTGDYNDFKRTYSS